MKILVVARWFCILCLATAAWTVTASTPEEPGGLLLTCKELFQLIEISISRHGFSDSFPSAKLNPHRSVIPQLKILDAEGAQFWIFYRKGPLWGSYETTNGYNPQGDPRWFLESVGIDVSPVWGFYWDGDRRLQVPMPATWASRVDLVSAQLGKLGLAPIAIKFDISFHESESEFASLETRSLYAERFIEYGSVPIGPKGIQLLHDYSFHTGSVIISEDVLGLARARIEYFYKAYLHLQEKAIQGSHQESHGLSLLWSLSNSLRMYVVNAIDNGTGLVNPNLADAHLRTRYRTRENEDEYSDQANAAFNVYLHLLGPEKVSPSQQLREFLRDELYGQTKKAPSALRLADQLWLARELELFDKNYHSSLFTEFDPRTALSMTLGELCVSMMRRRQELRAASLQLMNSLPPSPLFLEVERDRLPRRSWWRRLFFTR